MAEFSIISKEILTSFPAGNEMTSVYLLEGSTESDIHWTYARSKSKRFLNQRKAYDFLVASNMEGKTIEDVDTEEENNIDWQ